MICFVLTDKPKSYKINSDYRQTILVVLQFCGRASKTSLAANFELKPTMFSVFVLNAGASNTAPELMTSHLSVLMNGQLEVQLNYTDAEKDDVVFELLTGTHHGDCRLTQDGVLSFVPLQYYQVWF